MNDDEIGDRFRARAMNLESPTVPLASLSRPNSRSRAASAVGMGVLALVMVGGFWLFGSRFDRPAFVGGSPVSSVPALVVTLPAVPSAAPGSTRICNDMALAGTLRGDRSDPRGVWLENPSGQRIDIAWPAGFTARFDTTVSLIGSNGRVVAIAGDLIRLGGSFDRSNTVFEACSVGG